jgi:hypothetical protein
MKPSEILDEIGKLSEEDASLFTVALDYGIHDEWDCGISQFFELGFGGPELTIAAKAGAYCARAHEDG